MFNTQYITEISTESRVHLGEAKASVYILDDCLSEVLGSVLKMIKLVSYNLDSMVFIPPMKVRQIEETEARGEITSRDTLLYEAPAVYLNLEDKKEYNEALITWARRIALACDYHSSRECVEDALFQLDVLDSEEEEETCPECAGDCEKCNCEEVSDE